MEKEKLRQSLSLTQSKLRQEPQLNDGNENRNIEMSNL